MSDLLTTRLTPAVVQAQDAFWASIAASFPECKTGDFPFDAAFKLDAALTEAVLTWLSANFPNFEAEQQRKIIDLEAVAKILTEAGFETIVEMTGGGVATLFVGACKKVKRTVVRDGNEQVTEQEGFELVAGPGWFEGPGYSAPRADLMDFCFGPDDEGQTEPTYVREGDEKTIARDIIAFIERARAESAHD